MPTTDTASSHYTAEQTSAYEAYLAAMAEHNIVCARRGATTREKMDAAFAASRAFDRFCELAGLSIGRTNILADRQRLKQIEGEFFRLTEATRSAYSMIHAANGMGVIERRPDGIDAWDHDACVCLFQDAQVILRNAIQRADGQ